MVFVYASGSNLYKYTALCPRCSLAKYSFNHKHILSPSVNMFLYTFIIVTEVNHLL